MKKMMFLIPLASVIVLLMIDPSGIFHSHRAVQANSPSSTPLPKVLIGLLPAGTTIPERLPSTITDPILLTGWVYLYNQQEPLSAWNGETLTGREIAQAVIDRNVTIQWNKNNECNGASCTERPVCQLDHACQAAKNNPDRVDILITTLYQNRDSLDIPRLAGTLAHEMVHYLMPFGGKDDTLYEEFWAFSIGSQISKNAEMDFEGYDPLQENCLKLWFHSNREDYYGYMPSYPPSIEPYADAQQSSCSLIRRLPGETNGFPNGK